MSKLKFFTVLGAVNGAFLLALAATVLFEQPLVISQAAARIFMGFGIAGFFGLIAVFNK